MPAPTHFFTATGRIFALTALCTLPAMRLAAQTISTLVTITPCRVMDTRPIDVSGISAGSFGAPSLSANSSRDIPIASGSCNIPGNAVAYSLNVTIVPHAPFPYLVLWPTGQAQPLASTINAYGGTVAANAAIVPAGSNGSISVFSLGDTELILDINGYFLPQTIQQPTIQQPTIPTVVAQSTGANLNSAFGAGASSTGGAQNTAIGASALASNYDGAFNTAVGAGALAAHSTGSNNTAVGTNALSNSSNGYNNSVLGSTGMQSNTSGHDNIALGYAALSSNTTGQGNTAVGANTLPSLTTGINNTALGVNAGANLTTGSNNVDIANAGVATDSGVIRIGTAGQQFAVYVQPVLGNYFGGSQVMIDANGKLGVNSSSRRYKEDVQDIGEVSEGLFQLRPVQFRYRKPADNGSKPLQYGLIAEEVNEVYPQLVTHNREGQIEGVQYQQLPALLINELQKQQKMIARQQEEIRTLTIRLEGLESQAGVTPAEHSKER